IVATLLFFTGSALAASGWMGIRAGTGELAARLGRGGAEHFRYPANRFIGDYLSGLKHKNVFIHNGPALVAGWWAYFARHNRVWLGYPTISDISIAGFPGANIRCDDLPANLHVIDVGAQYA